MITINAPSERDILTAVRGFLLSILPTGVEIVQAQGDRLAAPTGNDFVTMVFLNQERLSTNAQFFSGTLGANQIQYSQKAMVQLDFHGPNSSLYVTLAHLLWRDGYSNTIIVGLDSFVIVPLYTNEPHQAPFLNAENQYENRWILSVYLQVNPMVTVPQDSATTLSVTLYEVT